MKRWTATYYRRNPQVKAGGYTTYRTVEARSIKSAVKKAEAIAREVLYGGMELLEVREEATA